MQQVSNNLLGQATTVGKQLLSATDAAAAKTALGLSTVASSGAYADLSGKPALANVATSGAYSDLTGTPSLATVATSGAYNDLTGKPALATVATSGSYNDLADKPATSSAFGGVYEFLEHFLTAGSLAGNMSPGNLNGGSVSSGIITGNQFGIALFSTGTTTANLPANARVNATSSQVTLGDGELVFAIRFAQASTAWYDATLVGGFRAGLMTSINADSQGVYFRAKTNQLEIVVRPGNLGTEVAQTIGTISQNQFVTAMFKINAAATQQLVYLDGQLVATMNVNMAAQKLYHVAQNNRDAAIATNVQVYVDFLAMRYTPTTPFFVL